MVDFQIYINIGDFLPIMFFESIANQLLLLLPSDQSETEKDTVRDIIPHTYLCICILVRTLIDIIL